MTHEFMLQHKNQELLQQSCSHFATYTLIMVAKHFYSNIFPINFTIVYKSQELFSL